MHGRPRQLHIPLGEDDISYCQSICHIIYTPENYMPSCSEIKSRAQVETLPPRTRGTSRNVGLYAHVSEYGVAVR